MKKEINYLEENTTQELLKVLYEHTNLIKAILVLLGSIRRRTINELESLRDEELQDMEDLITAKIKE